MTADRPPRGLGILWVPIVTALLAAAVVTLRSCRPMPSGSEPAASARTTSAR